MSPHFIPQDDAGVLHWLKNFASRIFEQASVYMLAPSDAAAITQAVQGFADAYAVATNPATRTMVTVNSKDNARNAAVQLCRQYSRLIKFNAGISDADKIAIGVRPVNTSRSRINVPQTSPLVHVIAATPGVHSLRYADSTTPTSSAKPFGAAELQLFVAIADEPVHDPAESQFLRTHTRNPIQVDFKAKDGGKIATYFARWSSPSGEFGPWSAPQSMHIAA